MPVMHVKKINALSMGKIVGLYLGIISFLLYAILTLAIIPFLIENGGRFGLIVGVARTEMIISILTFLFVPVFYGIVGFIAGTIIALAFNFASEHAGGFELEIESYGTND
ncbi:hypothetical protein RE474_00325 [Methanolobus sediminis]|uniref:DUF3566 domain-containing protein n=1 Tax=Methanolobus sediminis TaxID=3072978 RepID=A0AA51YM43_9EURY|nr:hypothetical protein [Methanolobus sediminis]WMW25198.1 hypothetical protein RE474_00325 [Methanolobus sediminis]